MKELNRKPEILHALRIQVIGSRSKRRDEDEESGSEEEMTARMRMGIRKGVFSVSRCIQWFSIYL